VYFHKIHQIIFGPKVFIPKEVKLLIQFYKNEENNDKLLMRFMDFR